MVLDDVFVFDACHFCGKAFQILPGYSTKLDFLSITRGVLNDEDGKSNRSIKLCPDCISIIDGHLDKGLERAEHTKTFKLLKELIEK